MDAMVIGDLIKDEYIFGTSDRLCPEAPVPVIVPPKLPAFSETMTFGGAGLVFKQLTELGITSTFQFGSESRKRRIFVGNHLVCRLDYDSEVVTDHFDYEHGVVTALKKDRPSVLIVSDYGKGSFTEQSAKRIMQAAKILGIRVLVDAKYNWEWWKGAWAFFPNQRESGFNAGKAHVIQKLGSSGCDVDGIPVPLENEHEARDTTGAGDCFLAGFAAHLLNRYTIQSEPDQNCLIDCARFANRVAAASVTHIGTHATSLKELENAHMSAVQNNQK